MGRPLFPSWRLSDGGSTLRRERRPVKSVYPSTRSRPRLPPGGTAAGTRHARRPIFGPFTLEKELGSGAMGSVYRALFHEEGKADRMVALQGDRFWACPATNRLWPVRARIQDPQATQASEHRPLIRQRPLQGNAVLRDGICRRPVARQGHGWSGIDDSPSKPPFTWEEVVEMGMPLCAALQHAHDKGIIHRDLKPSNLMI